MHDDDADDCEDDDDNDADKDDDDDDEMMKLVMMNVCLFVGCLTSQQHASVSQVMMIYWKKGHSEILTPTFLQNFDDINRARKPRERQQRKR